MTEDNVPQTITFCDYQKLEDNVLPAIDVPTALPFHANQEKEKPKVESVTRTEIKPEASGGDLKYRDRRLLVLYFDLTAMPSTDQLRAFDAREIHHQTNEGGRPAGHHQVRRRGRARAWRISPTTATTC